jgi:hypothetical protein
MDLKGETLKLLRSQIAGFYEPHQKEMVLVRGTFLERLWTNSETVSRRDEMIFAHELTHALQDQHFHIEAMLNRVKDNDDESLALKSVAEGDATLAGISYVSGGLDNGTLALFISRLADMPQQSSAGLRDVPVGLTVPLLFQYSDGTSFVGEAWRRGGWAGVDALYRNPPISTQQIMQPALYFDSPSPPAHIDITGYENVLKDWKKVDDDRYGELLLKVILERNLPPHAASVALLSSWAGDRVITLEKANALTLVWVVAFNEAASATQFATTYQSILDHLAGRSNPHCIDVREAAVLIAIGPGAESFPQLAAAVWKASTITRVKPSADGKRIRAASRASTPPVAIAHQASSRD